MYNVDTVKKGFEFLGVETLSEKESIIDTLVSNMSQQRAFDAADRFREEFENRFVVPVMMTKKFYDGLLKETKAKISDLKMHARTCMTAESFGYCWIEGEMEAYIEKAEKIKTAISSYGKGKADVTGAKDFPIDQMVEFRGGFAKCIFVQENTPSMKYYPKTNTVYCFSCNKKFDAIDVYMQLHGVTFGEAVKKLTRA